MLRTHAKKIKFNLISAVLCQVVTIAIGFILPRLYLENFGSTVNGVLSTIKQIFTYLCLLEAGIGLATAQALLKPVAQSDYASVNGILSATKRHYEKTGVIYALSVLAIALFYGFAVDTGLAPYTVIALVLLNGIPSLVTFFVQGKYQILMETDGRQYVITNSQIALQIVSGFGKIAVLLLTDNLILVQASYCLFAVLQLLYLTVYARRTYRWLDLRVAPDTRAIAQKNSVLVHQISSMIFNNTDILLLSFLCDFRVVSVYYIYNLFFSQVELFVSGLAKGLHFALGQLFSVDRARFLEKFSVYEMCYIAVNFAIYTLMCVFLLPVIQIYTGGISDANYINPLLLFLVVLAKLFHCGKLPVNQVVEYSGHFSNTAWQAVSEMVINITVSVVCILRWGICGALIGTIAALVFRAVAIIDFSNRKILRRSVWNTYVLWLINGAVFTAIFLIFGTTYFCDLRFGALLWRGVLHALWIVPLYLTANLALQPKRARLLLQMLKRKEKIHEPVHK